MSRRKRVKKKPFIILILLVLLLGGGYFYINYLNSQKKTETRYLASEDLKISLQDLEGNNKKEIV